MWNGMLRGFQDVSCRRSEEVEVEARRRNIPVVALAGAELAENVTLYLDPSPYKAPSKALTHDDQPTHMIPFVLFQWTKITTHALLPLSARGLMETPRMKLMELLHPAEARLESASNGRTEQGDKS